MKVVFIKQYHDRIRQFNPGETAEFTEAMAKILEDRGFVKLEDMSKQESEPKRSYKRRDMKAQS